MKPVKHIKIMVLLLLLCAGIRGFPILTAYAMTDMPLSLTGEDETNGFHYSLGNYGGLYSSTQDGGTDTFIMVKVDEGMNWQLMLDGIQIEMEQDTVLMNNGSYELIVWPQENPDDIQGIFSFTVQNEFGQLTKVTSSLQSDGNHDTDYPETELGFNMETELYVYKLPNGHEVQMSVPSGAITNDAVTVIDDSYQYFREIWLDGVKLDEEQTVFEEPGNYHITILCSPSGYANPDNSNYNINLFFRILDKGQFSDEILNAPLGFDVAAIRQGAELQAGEGAEWKHLTKEGSYTVSFHAKNGRAPDYQVEFLRDTYAPFLKFSRELTGKRIKGPLTYSLGEAKASVAVYLDGKPIEVEDQTLVKSGHYSLIVSDEGGNERMYSVWLKNPRPFFNAEVIGLLGLIVFLAGGYVVTKEIEKKKTGE